MILHPNKRYWFMLILLYTQAISIHVRSSSVLHWGTSGRAVAFLDFLSHPLWQWLLYLGKVAQGKALCSWPQNLPTCPVMYFPSFSHSYFSKQGKQKLTIYPFSDFILHFNSARRVTSDFNKTLLNSSHFQRFWFVFEANIPVTLWT